ncbi:[FeFe] hydrogenase H-cluster maturation GTPase HydF [Odoribacter laneus]|mgnify:FL=1|jgi:hydrogenase maturation GTPase hydF|uniref:Hydrogenase maturation GTPase HydF n=1 Tax=Odoribacter laneus YIT 12061 TaxID=742817 RepID=H1DFQ7_9BACT|nr:[FeFe] hydrogenase H-cluster maturation GTPase HydF [Odoribacter laneus]EHP48730.1 hydrogenase maturation GTPase HydF [Odoribacter laneus YIT 12061]MBS1445112.1 [FeFe] hydrogenase H-cluster maturation GTPase HydF [Odoribacter sp.]GKI23809.1 [FeFe] hydrogenase H-cluster maturation GTPase HydF [Odoribacter laneus]GKI24390.1 [FeFe] hydrogenase H-cluster maturation GTPase HydF [Odoribacter laneus]
MEKLHIAIVGRRNSGKSSLINVLTGQKVAIVSDVPGTTTDPVKRSYEIPGFASVVFIDTAGIDDTGELGRQRIAKTTEILPQSDFILLLITENRFEAMEENLVRQIQNLHIPFLILHNKSDILSLHPDVKNTLESRYKTQVIDFCCRRPENISELFEAIRKLKQISTSPSLLGKIIRPRDILLLVTPIDSEVPVGRLILPQVQMIRDILDNHSVSIVLQPEEISSFLLTTGIRPRLVITDSQVFKKVAEQIPANIPLTSFSIVLAHRKGYFQEYIKGTRTIDRLQDGDTILLLESCSHHTTCEDIGRVKIPALLKKYTGKQLNFEFIPALDPLEKSPSAYALVIQCGGCMVTSQQLQTRLRPFIESGIPVSNYGMTLAFLNGIFERSIQEWEKE